MTTYYIHIGLHKTGSTTIQKTMYEHREALACELNVFYPPFKKNLNVLYSFFSDDRKSRKKSKKHRITLQDVSKSLKGSADKKVVISGESISLLDRKGICRFKEFLDGYSKAQRVIVYVRDPAGYAASRLQQKMRGQRQGRRNRLEQFQEKVPSPHYRRLIEPFVDCFGRESVDIRSFNDAVKNPFGLFGDFLHAVGEDSGAAARYKEIRSNSGLSYEALLLWNEIRKAYPQNCEINLYPLLKDIPGSKFTLSPEVRERLLNESQEDLDWLSAQMGRNPFDNVISEAVSRPEWSEKTVKSIALKLYELRRGKEKAANGTKSFPRKETGEKKAKRPKAGRQQQGGRAKRNRKAEASKSAAD